jgi:hypothetical protein
VPVVHAPVHSDSLIHLTLTNELTLAFNTLVDVNSTQYTTTNGCCYTQNEISVCVGHECARNS